MASLNQLRCSTLSLTSTLTPTPSIFPPRRPGTVSSICTKPFEKPRLLLADVPRPAVFCVQAAASNEGSGAAETEVEKVKKALVESFYGTDGGVQATSDTRGEIVELINQLEVFNPTPVHALAFLNGKWIIA
ncbi:hypothetical protein RIF29_40765 [Crotalaria pallida]|uniref:Plastid lipid-associated protein/fibrillin conserved domain-containing protein n=1 Tax=Crotalaria pallida TaxID=3830 RepID=A0AAN9HQZ6_CROPI